MPAFLHVKFAAGRPPESAADVPFVHELDVVKHPLPDSLKMDTQRKGVVRYLKQTFAEGSYVHDVVHERERDSMYVLVTSNWKRSVGDQKLHLSLYVYQEEHHVATWHAYTDRSVSYSREGGESDPPPDGGDPYSTSEALAAVPVSTPLPPPSPSDRPRLDRPAAAPVLDDGNDRKEPVRGTASVVSDEQPPLDWKSVEGGSDASDDEGAPLKKETAAPNRTSRSARSSHQPVEVKKRRSLSPSYSIVKSKPVGQPLARRDESSSRSCSRSRSPPPTKAVQSKRDASPASVSDSPPPSLPKPSRSSHHRAPSPSPSPQRSPSPPSRKSKPQEEPGPAQTRCSRSARRPSRAPSSSPPTKERSPSPQPPPRPAQVTKTPGRFKVTNASARDPSSSPPPPKERRRSPSPRAESPVKAARAASNAPEDSKKKPSKPRYPSVSPSRAPPPSRSSSLPPKSRLSRSSPPRLTPSTQQRKSRRPSPSPSRSRSHSPPPPRTSRRGRSPTRSRSPPPTTVSASPPRPTTPVWRSVSRNRRHRYENDSDAEDTLVRGDLEDAALDIPAGGEVSLLEAKRRSASNDRSARKPRPAVAREGGFDVSEVEKAPPPPPSAPIAKGVLGGWIKSVGALLKTEAELAVGEVEEKVDQLEVDEEHERAKRKEERRIRREARAARRAARETGDERETVLTEVKAETMKEERLAKELAEKERALRRKEEELRRKEEALREEEEQTRVRERKLRREKEKEREREQEQERLKEEEQKREQEREKEKMSRSSRRSKPVEADEDDFPAPLSSKNAPAAPRSSSRRHNPPSESDDDEPPPKPSSRPSRRVDDATRIRASRHRHRGSVVDSPSEIEDEPPVSTVPPRQRAMSISATVDAGLKNFRQSVAKMVSKPAEGEEQTRKPDGRRRDVDEEKVEKEQRVKEKKPRTRQASRPRGGETDVEVRRTVRRIMPQPVESESDEAPLPPAKSSSSRPSETPAAATNTRSSARSSRLPPPADPLSDSDTSLHPRRSAPSQSKQRPQPPPASESETDRSEASSRASLRRMDGESEPDEAHKLAMRNARRNSVTVPAAMIEQLRAEEFSQGRQSIPPTLQRPALHRPSSDESSGDDQSSAPHLKNEPAQSARISLPPPSFSTPVPPILSSPVSPQAGLYAFPSNGAPLRPQPVRPSISPSSIESSDCASEYVQRDRRLPQAQDPPTSRSRSRYAPSPSPTPPLPPQHQSDRRRKQSFSRTQPELAFSSDDDGGYSISAANSSRRALAGGASTDSRARPQYSSDEAEYDDGRFGGPLSSAPLQGRTSSRTIVSKPSAVHKQQQVPPSSFSSRTIVSSTSSSYSRQPPSPSHYTPPSAPSTSRRSHLPVEDIYSAGHFTGFDVRGSRRNNLEERQTQSESRQSRSGGGRQGGGSSSSRQMYGEAPVGRRMAKRLGL